ncbi:MAG: hypothetical protein E6713_12655 [Sporomusaceae bacterium]|nr:hypothetical protein [Sporomusaceae bacterium]
MKVFWREEGYATVFTIALALFLGVFIAAMAKEVQIVLATDDVARRAQQAEYAAQAGFYAAFAEVSTQPNTFRQSWVESLDESSMGEAFVTIEKKDKTYYIHSTGSFRGANKALQATLQFDTKGVLLMHIEHDLHKDRT